MPSSRFRTGLAFFIRKLLTKVVTPLTGGIQRQEVSEYTDTSFSKKVKNSIIRWVSLRCSGAITFAYPLIPYNPIDAHRQKSKQAWASALLHVPDHHLRHAATSFLKNIQSLPRSQSSSHRSSPSFSILLCFYHHLHHFKYCLHSIEEALRLAPDTNIEILLINDDPSIDLSPLLATLNSSTQNRLSLRVHTENQGICRSLNEAVSHARGEWLLYLDCDDCLEPNVFSILEKTIQEHPDVRFISSRAIDIDTDNDVLFWRLRSERPYQLIDHNSANHLKVIRKDLHREIGLFKPAFEGCQDYEFALRTAIQEPILFIPNYLYRYRWHRYSQTVSYSERQRLTAMRVRQTYLLAIHWLLHGTEMLSWEITGAAAASWQEKFPPSKTITPRYKIHLEAALPCTTLRYQSLLIEVATRIIDALRTGNQDTSFSLSLCHTPQETER